MRVAVIGVGGIGFYHASEYIRRGHRVVLCDTNPDRLNGAVEHPDLKGCLYTGDWRDVAGDIATKAVSICTPTATHVEIARAMLTEGKFVMLEKPIGANLDEALKLSALSRALTHPDRLCIGYQYHLLPFFQGLRAAPPEDIKKIFIWAKRKFCYPPGPHYCGPVRDILVHMLQAILHALPALRPLELMAEMMKCANNPYQDEGWARFVVRFAESDAVMVAETAYESDEDKWALRIDASERAGVIEWRESALDDESFCRKMGRWMDHIEGGAQLDLPAELETALDVERVAQAAHDSAANSSKWVAIAA